MSNDENTLVAGSSPAIRTIIPKENEVSDGSRTDSAQKSVESDSQKVKFPKVIRYRRRRIEESQK